MDVRTTTTLFALLSLLAAAGALGLLVVGVASRSGTSWAVAVRDWAAPHLLGAVAAVTGTATLGSLYYSQVVGFEPCSLCWYQRIFMYPMALMSTAALIGHVVRGRARGTPSTPVWWLVPWLSGIGLVIAAYHITIERIPAAEVVACSSATPCSAILVEALGFATIPTMAATAFAFAGAAAVVARTEARTRGGDAITPPIPDTRQNEAPR